MGGEHDPFVGLAGIVVDQGLGFGRPLLGLDRHGDGRPSGGAAREARGGLGRDAERRDTIASLAARGARHDMARQGPGNEESHRAIGARHVVLAAAMDGAGGEHQLVPHQHDAALDLRGMCLEFVRRAAAEIDHLGGEPAFASRDGADQRMTRHLPAVAERQHRLGRAPAAVRHRDRAPGVVRRGRPHPLAQERKGALLTLAAGQPPAAVADIVEVAPQAFIGGEAGGGIGIETHDEFSSPLLTLRRREAPSRRVGNINRVSHPSRRALRALLRVR